MSSSLSKASWVVAASVGAVEVLKDQAGLCRWNYALRSLHQHARNQLGSLSQARMVSSNTVERSKGFETSDLMKAKKFEVTMDKVMYLNAWGPK